MTCGSAGKRVRAGLRFGSHVVCQAIYGAHVRLPMASSAAPICETRYQIFRQAARRVTGGALLCRPVLPRNRPDGGGREKKHSIETLRPSPEVARPL